MKLKHKAAVMTIGIGVMLIIFALLSLIMLFPVQASLSMLLVGVTLLIVIIYKLLKQKYDEEEELS
jgi:membrane protein implicated in regulation of membrane protease activity